MSRSVEFPKRGIGSNSMLVSRREGSEGFMSPVVSSGIISNIHCSITQMLVNILFIISLRRLQSQMPLKFCWDIPKIFDYLRGRERPCNYWAQLCCGVCSTRRISREL